jgi:hypothetical protein
MLRVLRAMSPDERESSDQVRERIEVEHRLHRIAERLRQLQADRSQAIRAEREQWPTRERRYHERRRT